MSSKDSFSVESLTQFIMSDEESQTLLARTFDTMTLRAAADPQFHAWEFLNVFVLYRARVFVSASGSSTSWWKAFPYNLRCDVTDVLFDEWKNLKEEK